MLVTEFNANESMVKVTTKVPTDKKMCLDIIGSNFISLLEVLAQYLLSNWGGYGTQMLRINTKNWLK